MASVTPDTTGKSLTTSAVRSSVMLDAVRSNSKIVVSTEELPAGSVASTCIVSRPSASASGTTTEKSPNSSTIAVKICVSPFESVMVTRISVPSSRSTEPEISGVATFITPFWSMLIIGAVVSTSALIDALTILPASSST